MIDFETPEILRKAIDNATNNGWKSTRRQRCDLWDNEQQCWYEQEDRQHVYEIIFSHDFAKSLWGEYELVGVQMIGAEYVYQWQYHLQMMVIASDPIAYIGKHLDG